MAVGWVEVVVGLSMHLSASPEIRVIENKE
jgi:hypothetical protein